MSTYTLLLQFKTFVFVCVQLGPSGSALRSIWVRRAVHLGPSGSAGRYIWVHLGPPWSTFRKRPSKSFPSVEKCINVSSFMFLHLKLRGNLNQRQRSRQNNQSFSKKYRRSLALIPNLEDIIAKAVTS